ncbi:MAG: PilZ domain-containing protein, partial [Pseudomonadota bacterium]
GVFLDNGGQLFEAIRPGTEPAAPAGEDNIPQEVPPTDDTASTADVAGTDRLKQLAAIIEENAPLSYGVLGMFALVLSIAGWLVWRVFVINRARAFPRVPFGGYLPITDSLGRRKDRIVVDISQGGLMIERPNTASFDAFDHISVRLPDGEHALDLMWENEFFMGYKFHSILAEDTFAAVMAIEVRKPSSASAPNENSAPEGAVGQSA